MMKYVPLLAAVLLAASASTGMAQSQAPSSQQRTGSPATSGQSGSQAEPRGTGITGAPSSSNPQAGGGGAAYQTPREVPENGGARTTTNPIRIGDRA
jgi:hypothetical protein